MANFPDRFLDELRLSISVLEYAKRVAKVEKSGTEWRLADNHSCKIDPRKNVWGDFGSGNNTGGNIFQLEQMLSGCSFPEAVEKVASIVGVKMPSGSAQRAPASSAPADRGDDMPPEPPDHPGFDGPQQSQPANGASGGESRVKKTYDYVDGNGGLVYQTARMEWIEDGKKRKSFGQRRLAPDGAWAWGLSDGPYLKSKFNGEWYQATKERLEKFRGAPMMDLEKVDHRLYRFDELREEMAQHESERRTIFIVEGEKDADTLKGWGLMSTTNSGGAKNWQAWMAEEFRDADVVLVSDADKAGRAREVKLGVTLRPIARSLRALWWPDHWPACPPKGDVTDWVEQGGGTVEKFFAIVDKLKPWTPAMPESNFNAQRYIDIDKPGKELTWLVKGVLTASEVSIWYGAWGSGKSFLITDCAMAIARGNRWMGNKTLPGLVMYQAGEGALGLRKRLRAYRKYHRLPETGDDIPFVLLPSRVDFFANDIDTNKLIEELQQWAAFYDHKLRLLVIDTLNAASPGADENTARDIGPVLNRARRIAEATGAHVALVDHTPKDGGSPRGWSGKMGNVDNGIAISRTDKFHRQLSEDGSRVHNREIREWTVAKQKDEQDRKQMQFVLKRVVLGTDEEGDEISSCIIEPIEAAAATPEGSKRNEPAPGYHQMNAANEDIMRCLVKAIKKGGRTAPAGIDAPPSEHVATVGEWQAEMIELQVGHEEITSTLRERIKKQIQRACRYWNCDAGHAGLIVKQNEYVWRTSRRVHMIDPPPPKPPKEVQTVMALAPGETEDDLMREIYGKS